MTVRVSEVVTVLKSRCSPVPIWPQLPISPTKADLVLTSSDFIAQRVRTDFPKFTERRHAVLRRLLPGTGNEVHVKLALITDPNAHISPETQGGSLPIWTLEVARRLAKTHEVTIFEAGLFESKSEREIDGVRVRQMPIARDSASCTALRHINRLRRVEARVKQAIFRNPRKPYFASRYFFPSFYLKTALSLRKEGFDAVHLANMMQWVPTIRALNPQLPIVLHMHSDWLAQLNRNLVARSLRKTELVLTPSDFITRRVQTAFPEFAERCHTVYNGADMVTNSGHNRPAPSSESPITILFSGRVSPEKGVHVLIEAFEQVSRQHPNVRLKIVGKVSASPPEFMVALSDDPKVKGLSRYYTESYGTILRRLVTPQIEDKVEFVGLVPHRLLGEHYASADIMVAPSVWSEPFGMIIPEAMANGTPVISTRGGGIPEIIEDGTSGLLVERGSVSDLRRAILSLVENPGLRNAMGEAARKRAECFSWDHTVSSLEQAFASVVPSFNARTSERTQSSRPAYARVGEQSWKRS